MAVEAPEASVAVDVVLAQASVENVKPVAGEALRLRGVFAVAGEEGQDVETVRRRARVRHVTSCVGCLISETVCGARLS